MKHAEINGEHDEYESIETKPNPEVVSHGGNMMDVAKFYKYEISYGTFQKTE
jgi:hypothetical protein